MASKLFTLLSCVVLTMASVALTGCDEEVSRDVLKLKIGSKVFFLEIASDDATRNLGLGGRTEITENGGMIFVFPDMLTRSFVMRDCPIPMDIMFLDRAGRIVQSYTMVPEQERGPGESPDDPAGDLKYEQRLKKYSSRFPCQYVIEIKDGLVDQLGLKNGDLIKLDTEKLKSAL